MPEYTTMIGGNPKEFLDDTEVDRLTDFFWNDWCIDGIMHEDFLKEHFDSGATKQDFLILIQRYDIFFAISKQLTVFIKDSDERRIKWTLNYLITQLKKQLPAKDFKAHALYRRRKKEGKTSRTVYDYLKVVCPVFAPIAGLVILVINALI